MYIYKNGGFEFWTVSSVFDCIPFYFHFSCELALFFNEFVLNAKTSTVFWVSINIVLDALSTLAIISRFLKEEAWIFHRKKLNF